MLSKLSINVKGQIHSLWLPVRLNLSIPTSLEIMKGEKNYNFFFNPDLTWKNMKDIAVLSSHYWSTYISQEMGKYMMQCSGKSQQQAWKKLQTIIKCQKLFSFKIKVHFFCWESNSSLMRSITETLQTGKRYGFICSNLNCFNPICVCSYRLADLQC